MSDWSTPDGGWSGPGEGTPPPPPSSPPPPPPGQAPTPAGQPAGGWSGGRLIPLRPMRFGEILDASFKLFQRTFVQVGLLVLLTLGIFNLATSLVQPPTPGLLADPAEFEGMFGTGYLVRLLASGGIAIFAQLFVYPLVRGGATGIALEADRGGDSSWQAGLQLGLRLAGRLLGLAFLLLLLGLVALAALGVVIVGPIVLFVGQDLIPVAVVWGLVGALVLFVGALVASALIHLAVPVVVVEHLGPVDALRRSIQLVRPQLLRIVGLVFVSGIMIGVGAGVISALSLPFPFLGGVLALLATAVTATLASIVAVPLEANIALLLYVDARVRLEGLDVAVLTAELDRA